MKYMAFNGLAGFTLLSCSVFVTESSRKSQYQLHHGCCYRYTSSDLVNIQVIRGERKLPRKITFKNYFVNLIISLHASVYL